MPSMRALELGMHGGIHLPSIFSTLVFVHTLASYQPNVITAHGAEDQPARAKDFLSGVGDFI
jgi:hypothetical protein